MASGRNSKLIRTLALLNSSESGRILETKMVYGGLRTTQRDYVQNKGEENEFTVSTRTLQHVEGTYKSEVKRAKALYREKGVDGLIEAIDEALSRHVE